MKSRAILLAELEEKSRKNKQLEVEKKPGHAAGYDPYDNPGVHRAPAVDLDDRPHPRARR